MKTKIFKLVAILGFLGASFAPTAVAFDSTPPNVESCTISPREISDVTGGTVRVSIKVVSKNGLSSSVVSVLSLKNNITNDTRQLGGFIMTRESGDEFSGTWVQDISVKPGLMPGIYNLNIFPLTDKVQNGTSFLSCPGQDVSYGVSLATPTPAPTPKPTSTGTPSPTPTATASNSAVSNSDAANSLLEKYNKLLSQLNSVQGQLTAVNNKLNKICAARPKPKGC